MTQPAVSFLLAFGFLQRKVGNGRVRLMARIGLAGNVAKCGILFHNGLEPETCWSSAALKKLMMNKAEVEGSCGYADWAARGYRYSVVREENRWMVKRADPTWVF